MGSGGEGGGLCLFILLKNFFLFFFFLFLGLNFLCSHCAIACSNLFKIMSERKQVKRRVRLERGRRIESGRREQVMYIQWSRKFENPASNH